MESWTHRYLKAQSQNILDISKQKDYVIVNDLDSTKSEPYTSKQNAEADSIRLGPGHRVEPVMYARLKHCSEFGTCVNSSNKV